MSKTKITQTPTLANLLTALFHHEMQGVFVSLPGRIESYDSAKQSCSVQPLINGTERDEAGDSVSAPLPVITGVPLVFPGAGAYSITWPVARGDTVLLVFSSGALDRWLSSSSSGPVDPGDERRHDINDAIAIPGLRPFTNPVGSSGTHSAAMVMNASAIKLGSASASVKIARQPDLQVLKDAITAAPDGVGFGSALKGALTAWPDCSSIVASE